jgi:uncharacterized protein CbrC (UPF0167 family)
VDDELPAFRLYSDPVGDGRFVRSDAVCAGCDRSRRWIAMCLLYSADVPDDARFCPWCIADGSAVARFGGTFNDAGVGVAGERRTEVESRTPNVETWQDWEWPVHCSDAMVYLGQPTSEQLRRYEDAVDALRTEMRTQYRWPEEQIEELIDGFGPDSSHVAYLFRCQHCGTHVAPWDAD